MRYKYILLAFLLFPLLSYGQSGNLTIFSESGDKFYLVLNGEQQNDVAQTNVRIEELNQPYYSTRIIFENQKIPDIVKNLQVTDMTGVYMDVTYKIQRTGNRVDLNYFSMGPVKPKYIAPGNMYVRHYGRHGKDGDNEHHQYEHGSDRDRDYGDRGRDRDHRRVEIYPMNDADFAQAKEAVRNGKFSETMLATAKGILANNWLTTKQVMEMCKVFSFEDSKLEFAKAAYTRTTDPTNYFKVANVFSFSSSKEDLINFVNANSVKTNTDNGGRRGRYNTPVAMDNSSFAEAKATIKNGSFDETMIATAKSIMSNNYFTTDQVLELCKLFSFDDSKLQIAKAAYSRTLDRNNFFRVANSLSFSSSKDDLNNFIAGQR